MTVFLRCAAALVIGSVWGGVALAESPSGVALKSADSYVAGATITDAAWSSASHDTALTSASASAVAADAMTAGDGTECEQLLDCMCCCPPVWYVSLGTIVLHRNRPDPGTVVAANPAGTRFASPSDFKFGWDWGPDVTLARRLGNGDIIEGRFFDSDGSDARQSFRTPGGFIGAGFTGPANTLFDGIYFTKLFSTEINWRRQIADRWRIIAGFREIELRDQLQYKLNGNVATGQYNYNNHLWGGQLGANWSLTDWSSPVQINFYGKAGVYGNLADGGIYEFQGNNFIGSFVGTRTRPAFVGDIGLSAAYFLTQRIALRGGYQLLWLEHVARAGDAASRSLLNPALLRNVDNNGQLFYQGATASIDFVW